MSPLGPRWTSRYTYVADAAVSERVGQHLDLVTLAQAGHVLDGLDRLGELARVDRQRAIIGSPAVGRWRPRWRRGRRPAASSRRTRPSMPASGARAQLPPRVGPSSEP